VASFAGDPNSYGQTAQEGTAAEQSEDTGRLEEVVVTAERRSEDIQKTAASVTAIEGQDLQVQGRYQLSTMLEDVPGVDGGAATCLAGSTSSGTDTLAAGIIIRGIPTSGTAGGGITSVPSTAGYYAHDIYSDSAWPEPHAIDEWPDLLSSSASDAGRGGDDVPRIWGRAQKAVQHSAWLLHSGLLWHWH